MGTFWWVVTGLLLLGSVLARNNLLFLISLFLGLIGGVSLLWSRYCLAAVSYTRRFGAQRLFFGEETELAVEIVNAKPLPLAWLRAEDDLPAALEMSTPQLEPSHVGGRVRLVNLLALRWYERVTRRYKLRGARRGVWRFGPVELVSGDIFGFALQRATLPLRATVIVYPKVVPVTALGLPAMRPFGDLNTLRRVVDDPLRLMGARDYAPGDSFRHIHWKATAHRHTLQTKVFAPSAALPFAIFLNINTAEHLIEGRDPELQEYAITAAASLAQWAWEMGYPVGLFVNTVVQAGAQRVQLRPSRHPDTLLNVFDALAQVVDYGRWPIEAIVQMETAQLPYGTSVAIITATANTRLRQVVMDLRPREFGVTLLTLGDRVGEVALPGIRHYHIGGRKEWDALRGLALVG